MEDKFIRKPIGNFFLLKDLQIQLIIKIVLAIFSTTIVCSLMLVLVYILRYNSVAMYKMAADGDIVRDNIISIILPSLLISAIVNIGIGFIVGLYASRKYAVPIYKLEQWAKLLLDGKMTAHIKFREKSEFRQLTIHCNAVTSNLHTKFYEIKQQIERLPTKDREQPPIKVIESVLRTLELEAVPVSVHTNYIRVPQEAKGKSSRKS